MLDSAADPCAVALVITPAVGRGLPFGHTGGK
jgi:hypothetical protein